MSVVWSKILQIGIFPAENLISNNNLFEILYGFLSVFLFPNIIANPTGEILALLIPMAQTRCAASGALLLLFVPLFGASKRNTSKIRERDVTSALGGHLLVGQHNNQPKVGVCSRRDIGKGARPGRNMWGRHHTIVWGGKLSI